MLSEYARPFNRIAAALHLQEDRVALLGVEQALPK